MFDGLPTNHTDDLKFPGKKLTSAAALWLHLVPDEVEAAGVLQPGKAYRIDNEGHYFKREFADFVRVDHEIAAVNGTLALELAPYTLKVDLGNEVAALPRQGSAKTCDVADQVMRRALKNTSCNPVFFR